MIEQIKNQEVQAFINEGIISGLAAIKDELSTDMLQSDLTLEEVRNTNL